MLNEQTLSEKLIEFWCASVLFKLIGHFTVMCSVTWPMIASDLTLIQISMLFSLKYQLVGVRTIYLKQQKHWGLYQSKVTFSPTVTQRPGHWAENCKMIYSIQSGDFLSFYFYPVLMRLPGVCLIITRSLASFVRSFVSLFVRSVVVQSVRSVRRCANLITNKEHNCVLPDAWKEWRTSLQEIFLAHWQSLLTDIWDNGSGRSEGKSNVWLTERMCIARTASNRWFSHSNILSLIRQYLIFQPVPLSSVKKRKRKKNRLENYSLHIHIDFPWIYFTHLLWLYHG